MECCLHGEPLGCRQSNVLTRSGAMENVILMDRSSAMENVILVDSKGLTNSQKPGKTGLSSVDSEME